MILAPASSQWHALTEYAPRALLVFPTPWDCPLLGELPRIHDPGLGHAFLTTPPKHPRLPLHTDGFVGQLSIYSPYVLFCSILLWFLYKRCAIIMVIVLVNIILFQQYVLSYLRRNTS